MNELENRQSNLPERLEELAQEARIYAENATMCMLQLGRVLIEAKSMLTHGEWAAWVERNTGASSRTAENMMAAYRRFGNKPEFMSIGKSKLFKMLTLPEGKEEAFAAEHDLEHMSAREVDRAIREAKADDIRNEEPDYAPDTAMVEELRSVKEERDRLQAMASDAIQARMESDRKLSEIQNGAIIDAQLIEQQQNTIDQLNEELNRYRVQEARGEQEHDIGDEMSAERFRRAVHEFMGSVHYVPQMGSAFATMRTDERQVFDTLLRSVEEWTAGARRAMNHVEGGFIDV